jgi:hypothetical protein
MGRDDERSPSAAGVLLDQLGLLIYEAEALQPQMRRIPDRLLSGVPAPGVLSIKQMYGVIAALDEQVHTPHVDALLEGSTPAPAEADLDVLAASEPWNDYPMDQILGRISRSRAILIERLAKARDTYWMDDSEASLARFALRIIERETDLQREVGHRLHESHLTDRPLDLPK